MNYDAMENCFDSKMGVDAQLASIMDKILLTEAEIAELYDPICQELNEIFRPVFKKCQTYKFGSTFIGLGFKNSDLDMYLDIGKPIVEENSDTVGPHVISIDKVFSIILKVLHDHPKLFSKIIPITNAQSPIIKFTHKATNIICDISVKSILPIHNSELVKFYLNIDPRFLPAMTILKYWLNNCNSKSNTCINKYTLTILFIFYLQQIRLVPSVMSLKDRCSVPVLVNGWQVNFNKVISDFEVNKEYSSKSVPELLEGFFEFYANYNFEENVICPHDANSWSKTSFEIEANIPDSMSVYRDYLEYTKNAQGLSIQKSMCVQDPFQLNRNLAGNIQKRHLEKFQIYCKVSEKILTLSTNCQDLFQKLFCIHKKPNVKLQSGQPITFRIHPNDFCVSNNKECLIKNSFIESNWFFMTYSMVKQYFDEVLDLQVTSDWVNKSQNQNDVHFKKQSNTQRTIVMNCRGFHCLWVNRKDFTVVDTSKSLLEREIQITQGLIKKMDNDTNVNINFQCLISRKIEPGIHVHITLTNNSKDQEIFNDLANHLTTKLPTVVKKTYNFMRTQKRLPFR